MVLRCDSIAWECILCVVRLKCFILAFDNVWEWNWGDMYLRQIALWRKALNDLPASAAHALEHKNAERLWRLPPAKPIRIKILPASQLQDPSTLGPVGGIPCPTDSRSPGERDYF